MRAKTFVNVTRIGEERDHLLYGTFPSSSAIKIVLSKHVVLIMRIINAMINMDDIRQKRPNESPNLKLNKRLKWKLLSKKFWDTR